MQAHHVFLSYNWRDAAAAELVARALRQQGLSVFLDRWYLVPGRSWTQALEEALRQCGAVAVLLGPSGLGPWQLREKDIALDRQSRDQTFPVIPVLLPGAEAALGFLKLNTWVDLRDGIDDTARLAMLAAAVRGEPPSPELQERLQTTLASICPYRGLRYFREEDEPFFFGREQFTTRLVEATKQQTLVAVVGASGSGKSSVVRAGLVPCLRRGQAGTVWEVASVIPGERPLNALAAALLPLLEPERSETDRLAEVNKLGAHLLAGTVSLRDVIARILEKQPGTDRLLLIVDQWEELYTLCHDQAARERMVDELLAACTDGPLTVVMTLRGDFYGHVLNTRAMADRLQGTVINLGPMNHEELERSIKCPAEKVGLNFEAGLVGRILEDVSEEPGNLPLLEFVLEALWQTRRGGELLHEAYESMGGAQGAIASHAEKELTRLTPAERDAVRRVFSRLVCPGEGSEDIRRRATHAEVGEDEWSLVKRLADARLLVTGRDDATGGETFEISHEALIRKWDRLRRWISGDREFLLWRQRLESAMAERRRLPADTGTLLREARLVEAERWLKERPHDLTTDEERFIKESTDQRKTEQAVERRRRWRIVQALATGLAIAIVAGAFALTQWWRAEAEARHSLARRIAAQALYYQDLNPELALLLAAQGEQVMTTPETKRTLLEVLKRNPLVPKIVGRQESPLVSVAFDAGSAAVASGGTDGKITVWDVANRSHSEPQSGRGQVRSITSKPGGWVAVGIDDGKLVVWDTTTQQERKVPDEVGGAVAAALDSGGTTVAVADQAGMIRLWDLGTWTRRGELRSGHAGITALAFSPDGSQLAAAIPDDRIVRWDVAAGAQRGELSGYTGIRSLAWGQGDIVAAGTEDGSIAFWDPQAGIQLGHVVVHDAPVVAVALSRDGTRVASADEDGMILLSEVGLEAWTRRACRMAGRDLTTDERREYLGDGMYGPACTPQENGRHDIVSDDMREVPAGWFAMGCNEDADKDCNAGEDARRVYVDTFAIDRTEVSVAQYRQCVEANACAEPASQALCNWGVEGRDDHPINCVTWFEAKQYCDWAGKRLPREAEWEKAARGSDGRKFPWGSCEFGDPSEKCAERKWANVADEDLKRAQLRTPDVRYVTDGYEDGFVTTAPVGSFPDGASSYGVLDMAGNVYEWVWDKVPGGRVMRGGSWFERPRAVRASFRFSFDPQNASYNIGFRCAR